MFTMNVSGFFGSTFVFERVFFVFLFFWVFERVCIEMPTFFGLEANTDQITEEVTKKVFIRRSFTLISVYRSFVYLSFCLSFFLCVFFVCLYKCRCRCLSVQLPVCLFVCLAICLSVCQFVRLFVCISVCVFVCLSICFSVYPRIIRSTSPISFYKWSLRLG